MIRLCINCLAARRGGGHTYLENFCKNIPKDLVCKLYVIVNSNDFVSLIEDDDRIKIVPAIFASKSVFHRLIWERFYLPGLIKKLEISHYYNPSGTLTSNIPKSCLKAVAFRNMLPFAETERKRYPLGYTRFRLWLLKRVYLKSFKRADKIILISQYAQELIRKSLPSINKKSKVIPHGLNEHFLKRADSLPKLPFCDEYYLYISILDVYKGQSELLDTWRGLVDKGFNKKLVLIGPMYKPYGKRILKKIKDLNLTENVYYLGNVDYTSLPSYYQNAKALLFASSCENCPNILLECLASKKLIFCSNFSPMPEFGKDAVVYFNPYEADNLLEKLEEFEKSPDKFTSFPEKAYKRACEFSWKTTVKRTLLYIME